MTIKKECYAEYYTATIVEWKKLLKPDKYKDIIIDSLSYLVKGGTIKVYGFVIMDNHIHLIWQPINDDSSKQVRLRFMKFTSQSIKFDLEVNHPAVLEKFYVGSVDRKYQFWKRNPVVLNYIQKRCFGRSWTIYI